jgi:hypothetical protein
VQSRRRFAFTEFALATLPVPLLRCMTMEIGRSIRRNMALLAALFAWGVILAPSLHRAGLCRTSPTCAAATGHDGHHASDGPAAPAHGGHEADDCALCMLAATPSIACDLITCAVDPAPRVTPCAVAPTVCAQRDKTTTTLARAPPPASAFPEVV